MKAPIYEIEIRGVLDGNQATALKEFLDSKGKFEQSFKRLSAEISPGFDETIRNWSNHDLNLRIKKSDQEEKISLKIGNPRGSKLEEHEVYIASGQFMTTLRIFHQLGFDKGIIYFWESWVYEYEGVEVKLSRYTDDYWMWEIEARDMTDHDSANKKVYDVAEKLGIIPLTGEEFMAEADYQNHHVFELYSIECAKDYLARFN